MVNKMKNLGIEPPKVNILEQAKEEKLNKIQKYPGNNKLDEKYDRSNRYGTFGEKQLDRLVDVYYNDPHYKNPQKNNLFHIEPYNQRFIDTEEQTMSFVNLSKEQERRSKAPSYSEKIKVEEYEEDYTEDHLKYEEEMRLPLPERKLIFSKETTHKNGDLPGIPNSQKRIDEIKFMQVKRRSEAALRIQKWFRGYKGRKYFKKELQKKNIRDEEDYGYFEVTEQGVRQFIADRKQKILDEKLKKKAIYDLAPEEDRFFKYEMQQESDPLNIFNIYKNKLNGKDPFLTPERSFVTMAETPTKSKSIKRHQAIEKYNADIREESSSIKESISGSYIATQPSKKHLKSRKTTEDDYSNDFESESIKESIIGGSGDQKRFDKYKSMSDIEMSISADKKKKSSSIRESITEDIIEESLANRKLVESVMSGMDKKRGKFNTFTSTDSIKEEISGSGFKNTPKITPRIHDSIPEELNGSDAYTEDFESGSVSKGKLEDSAKNILIKTSERKEEKYQPSMIETKEDILLRRRLEKKYGLDVPDKAEDIIFDMINAKNLYEQSSTAMHVVDKFERMMAKYEANAIISKLSES